MKTFTSALSIAIALLLIGAGTAASAAEGKSVEPMFGLPPKGVHPLIYEVNVFGKLESRATWATLLGWSWIPASDKSDLKKPIMKLAIHLPYKLASTHTNGAGFLQLHANPADSPFRDARAGGDSIVVDLEQGSASFNLEIIDPRTGKASVRGFIIKLQSEEPVVFIDPSCNPYSLKLHFPAARKNFLFAGLKCSRDFRANPKAPPLVATIYHSTDLKLHTGNRLKRRSEGPSWVELEGPAQGFASKASPYEGYLQDAWRIDTLLFSEASNRPTEGLLLYAPGMPPQRLAFQLGLGITSANYSENPGAIKLTQFTFTPKFVVTYAVLPSLLDVSFNAFFSAFTPIRSPSTLAEARFWGANGRVGYHLPFSTPETTYVFSLGYYLWGMYVSDASYGLSFVSGPQLFLSFRNAPIGAHPWGGYVKLAIVSEDVTSLSGGRELAAGGFYQLSRPGVHYPLSLTLDLANMQFASRINANSMSLTTYTLGIQTSW